MSFWAQTLKARKSDQARASDPSTDKAEVRLSALRWFLESTPERNVLNVKIACLGCLVKVARQRADSFNPGATYDDLTRIVVNVKHLDQHSGHLLNPSSVITAPDELGLEVLAASAEGLKTLRAHADELVRRAQTHEPFRPERPAARAGSRVSNRTGIRAQFTSGQREGFLSLVAKGFKPLDDDLTMREAESLGVTRAEVLSAYAGGGDQREQVALIASKSEAELESEADALWGKAEGAWGR